VYSPLDEASAEAVLADDAAMLQNAMASALAPAAGAVDDDKDLPSQCVICCDGECTHALIPCGHLCLCDECVRLIMDDAESLSLCPVCREPSSKAIRVYQTG